MSNCRTIRQRPPPRAKRTAISRWREAPCTISMFARFRQAITRMIVAGVHQDQTDYGVPIDGPLHCRRPLLAGPAGEAQKGTPAQAPLKDSGLSCGKQRLQLCLGNRHSQPRLEPSDNIQPRFLVRPEAGDCRHPSVSPQRQPESEPRSEMPPKPFGATPTTRQSVPLTHRNSPRIFESPPSRCHQR